MGGSVIPLLTIKESRGWRERGRRHRLLSGRQEVRRNASYNKGAGREGKSKPGNVLRRRYAFSPE